MQEGVGFTIKMRREIIKNVPEIEIFHTASEIAFSTCSDY